MNLLKNNLLKYSDIKYQVESDSSFWSITALIMYEAE